ncbi:hypothetical protein BACERE00177_05538 [Bacillus mobilis]|nr:hypothetical protein BACERE00177_05538 [Bacillus mobilis]
MENLLNLAKFDFVKLFKNVDCTDLSTKKGCCNES